MLPLIVDFLFQVIPFHHFLVPMKFPVSWNPMLATRIHCVSTSLRPLNSSALVRPVGGKETAVSYDFVKRKLDPDRSILRGTRKREKEKKKNREWKKGIVNIEISHEEEMNHSSFAWFPFSKFISSLRN